MLWAYEFIDRDLVIIFLRSASINEKNIFTGYTESDTHTNTLKLI